MAHIQIKFFDLNMRARKEVWAGIEKELEDSGQFQNVDDVNIRKGIIIDYINANQGSMKFSLEVSEIDPNNHN